MSSNTSWKTEAAYSNLLRTQTVQTLQDAYPVLLALADYQSRAAVHAQAAAATLPTVSAEVRAALKSAYALADRYRGFARRVSKQLASRNWNNRRGGK